MSLKNELMQLNQETDLIERAVDGFFAKQLQNNLDVSDEVRDKLDSSYDGLNEIIGNIVVYLEDESPFTKLQIKKMGIMGGFIAGVLTEISEIKEMPAI